MKIDIQRVKFKLHKPQNKKIKWYSWKLVCNQCGVEIHEFGYQIDDCVPEQSIDYCKSCNTLNGE